VTDLGATLVVARRELLERVKSRWFVIMTLLAPAGMIALIVIPALLAGRGPDGAKVEIIDQTGVIGPPLAAKLTDAKWAPTIIAPDTGEAAEMARIRTSEISGFITIPKDALDGGKILYRGDNGSSQAVQVTLTRAVTSVVLDQRGVRAQIPPAQRTQLLQPVNFEAEHTSGNEKGSSGLAAFFLGYTVVILLYMVITLYGVAVMRSVVQEKTSRVMELLVATIKPRSLMSGKILGVGGAGLIQIVVWLTMGALTLAYRAELLHALGAQGGGPGLPPFALGEIAVVVSYFVLGFFFYAAVFAAAGAMVSSEQDTQQVQMPISLLLVVGFACMTAVTNDPRGATSAVLTMIPFWSPMLMPMRYVLGGATAVDVVISLAILLTSTLLVTRLAARIYRTGVLMYGKRPTLQEVLRWIRY
jgi:ABC-2 type transport system permease protein